MRQVVNAAKGGPLLGHSSCIIRAEEEREQQLNQEDNNNYAHEEEDCCDGDEDMAVDDSHQDSSEEQDSSSHQQQRRQRSYNQVPKTKGPRQQIEKERRLRREIANSNERRRMQSINQGYMSLKRMLPASDTGEKLSKAAVLQNAADYMMRLLDERKKMMIRNAELVQALEKHPLTGDEAMLARKKRDVTESSDEGISMSYQSVQDQTEVVEELRKTVVDLRVQLERETQRRTLLEQTYTYNMMAAQAPNFSQQIPTTVMSTPLSPPQSRHGSIDEQMCERVSYQSQEMYDQSAVSTASRTEPQSFGKASSVASQNLNIIVEAIHHLEGDVHQPASASDKEVDSGVSHGESSDEAKSERSISSTPQPPPAHQTGLLSINHRQPYNPSVPLLYKPTFLSGYINSQQSVLQVPVSTNYSPSTQ